MKLEEFKEMVTRELDAYVGDVNQENFFKVVPQLGAKTWWEDFTAYMNESLKRYK